MGDIVSQLSHLSYSHFDLLTRTLSESLPLGPTDISTLISPSRELVKECSSCFGLDEADFKNALNLPLLTAIVCASGYHENPATNESRTSHHLGGQEQIFANKQINIKVNNYIVQLLLYSHLLFNARI